MAIRLLKLYLATAPEQADLARNAALDLLFGHHADEHRRLATAYRALTAEHVREVASRIVSVSLTVVTVLP